MHGWARKVADSAWAARPVLEKAGARVREGTRAAQGKRKKPAAPYSRAGGSRTTLGEEALDFRVRNGNGYGSLSMATGGKAG